MRGQPRALTRPLLMLAARVLAQRDEDLARILARHGPPPMWGRRPGFPTLVRIILEQQVSLASARAAFERLRAGASPLTADCVITLGEGQLRRLGLTRQKAATCIHLARAILEGELDLAAVARLEDAAARAVLTRIKGIGPWTADIYLLMALRRVDVWPSADLALGAAIGSLRGCRGPLTPEGAASVAEAWRPFRSVAARMLWQHYLADGA